MTSITFSNAALNISIQDDDGLDVVEVLEALHAFRIIAVSSTPTAAPVAAVTPAPVAEAEAEPEEQFSNSVDPAFAASFAAEVAAEEATAATEPELTDIEKVYGKGFKYENESYNPSLGFRQPVVGDVFLDPNPGDGSGEPKPRRKTTPTAYGPRLILSFRS